jgi:hypothetical protein
LKTPSTSILPKPGIAKICSVSTAPESSGRTRWHPA